MKSKKHSGKVVRQVQKKRGSVSRKPFSPLHTIIILTVLLIGLIVTVGAVQQQQLTTQHAQTVPIVSATPVIVTPTFACLGTMCTGTIAPTGVTIIPSPTVVVAQPQPAINLPTNPNGKTPPGQIKNAVRRLSNWFAKFIRFGGNPPGNPNIPGTNINPIGSNSGIRRNPAGNIPGNGSFPGRGNGVASRTAQPLINASGGGNIPQPTPPSNLLGNFLNLLRQLFGLQP